MIVLIRHGRVDLPAPWLASRRDALGYIENYDHAPLRPEQMVDANLTAMLTDEVEIFSSTLRRSIDTVSLLAPGRADVVAAELFGEEPLDGLPRLFGVAPIALWLALSRIAGVLRGDLRSRMHLRAGLAAQRLIDASHRGDCALVGHGWFNRAIGRALIQRGWRLTSRTGGSAPLSYAIYTRVE